MTFAPFLSAGLHVNTTTCEILDRSEQQKKKAVYNNTVLPWHTKPTNFKTSTADKISLPKMHLVGPGL